MPNHFLFGGYVSAPATPLHTPEVETSEPKPKPNAVDITLDEAKELLARAVGEKGADYVYEQQDGKCVYYTSDGSPSCLVGWVLSYKGLLNEDLVASDSTVAEVQDLVEEGLLRVDNETLALLTVAQVEQDQGQTWGRALEEALATYEESAQAYESEGYDDPSEDYWF